MRVSVPGRVIGSESLSVEDLALANKLLSSCKVKGVLVGALSGAADWDLRPLVLQSSHTYLLRLKSGASAAQLEHAHQFDLFLTQSGVVLECGKVFDKLWVLRRYFPRLLEHAIAKRELRAADLNQIVRDILQLLRMSHERGFYHGHLSASNIALENSKSGELSAYLLDAGYASANSAHLDQIKSLNSSGIAPELSSGAKIGAQSDIYSFGVLARGLFRLSGMPQISAIQDSLLQSCCDPNPLKRPELREVEESFFPEQALIRGGSATLLAKTGASLGSGRLLQITSPKPAANLATPPESRLDITYSKSQSMPQPDLQVGKTKHSAEIREGALDSAIETLEIPAMQAPQASTEKRVSLTPFLWVLLLIIAGLAFWRYGTPSVDLNFKHDTPDWSRSWISNQPELMREVAEAAVLDHDREAERVIIQDALSGAQRPNLNQRFMQVALNSLWSAELDEADQRLIVYLGVGSLVDSAPIDLPDLKSSHPALSLALAVSADLQKIPQALQQIELSKLKDLPAPIGASFEKLFKVGVPDLSNKSAVSLAHILFADISPEILKSYFEAAKSSAAQLELLNVLVNIAESNPDLAQATYLELPSLGGVLAKAHAWFSADQAGAWQAAPRLTILKLLMGQAPSQKLTLEQLADLLYFPIPQIREGAVQALQAQNDNPEFKSTFAWLSSQANTFDRLQSVSLLIALHTAGEKGEAFISAWFKNNPEPQTLLSLLLARKDLVKDDFFNLEAARYLSGVKWRVSLEQLKELAGHPETMVRALIVSRLDPQKREEQQILEAMSVVEPSARIREQIKARLGGGIEAGY